MLSHYVVRVNFNFGVDNETDIELEKKMANHDGAVHRVNDGSRYRRLRCQ